MPVGGTMSVVQQWQLRRVDRGLRVQDRQPYNNNNSNSDGNDSSSML